MLGAIIGDTVGSAYEFNNTKDYSFKLFLSESDYTDDSVMTLAVAQAILDCADDYSKLEETAVKNMQRFGRIYPDAGYGGYFYEWIFSDNPQG